MADVFDIDKRSQIMRAIRSKNTSPEIKIRKALHALGYRFRIHDKKLPGCPDLVFPKHKTVIQVRGCFWHQHEGCKKCRIPKSNQDYWKAKLEKNKIRDSENDRKLKDGGWSVLTVWECEINSLDKLNVTIKKLSESLLSKPNRG